MKSWFALKSIPMVSVPGHCLCLYHETMECPIPKSTLSWSYFLTCHHKSALRTIFLANWVRACHVLMKSRRNRMTKDSYTRTAKWDSAKMRANTGQRILWWKEPQLVIWVGVFISNFVPQLSLEFDTSAIMNDAPNAHVYMSIITNDMFPILSIICTNFRTDLVVIILDGAATNRHG